MKYATNYIEQRFKKMLASDARENGTNSSFGKGVQSPVCPEMMFSNCSIIQVIQFQLLFITIDEGSDINQCVNLYVVQVQKAVLSFIISNSILIPGYFLFRCPAKLTETEI